MQLISDHTRDVRSLQKKPGGYEWWYFDGIDSEGVYSFVVIFYEGNPFSTRYIKRLEHQNRSNGASPEDHPAVNISIYKKQVPIYYSFTEFDKADCLFDESKPGLQIGQNTMESTTGPDYLRYRINLKERLPSGDTVVGNLTFTSPKVSGALFKNLFGPTAAGEEGHLWNLVQPRAEVEANLKIYARIEPDRKISFTGTGYHDHNMGSESIQNEFDEWYWGRFHFEIGTLVYYLMECKNEPQQQAWLITPDNREVIQQFSKVRLQDKGWNRFGIQSARKILLDNENSHVTIQQARLLDNGPFYQRFSSDSFVNIPGKNIVEGAEGITEFIRPDRIYWRIFWPFVNMRIRHAGKRPHWVQRSKRLYRWTW